MSAPETAKQIVSKFPSNRKAIAQVNFEIINIYFLQSIEKPYKNKDVISLAKSGWYFEGTVLGSWHVRDSQSDFPNLHIIDQVRNVNFCGVVDTSRPQQNCRVEAADLTKHPSETIAKLAAFVFRRINVVMKENSNVTKY